MPNVTLHLAVVDRVLDAWRADPSEAPFPLDDPACLNAFDQGSFGPDLGYFPGGEPFLSDLAHYIRTGHLTRALVEGSSTPRERAFAWGWVTHVLADQAIHPVVGRAVGEFLGRGRTFVSAAADRTAHVRVEVGLDAIYSERDLSLRGRLPEPVFDGTSIRLLTRAYERTYGIPFDSQTMLASHITAVRMSSRALQTIGVMGSLLTLDPEPGWLRAGRVVLEGTLDAVRTAADRESMLLAFLTPVTPPAWLVEEVDAVLEGLPERMRGMRSGGLAALPDYNLDTGRVEGPRLTNPCGLRAARIVEARGGLAHRPKRAA